MGIKNQKLSNYAFMDASNLFYGGEKSLGWKIDYKKLIGYIRKQYRVTKIFYYGGVELNGFNYSPLSKQSIDLEELQRYMIHELKAKRITKTRIMELSINIKRIKFYKKLKEFGYILKLKPVKTFKEIDGRISKKANCDVDMTFDLMRLYKEYAGILILSGDGDFAVVLKYLIGNGKEVKILARGERTAREIRQLAGGDFRDFNYLREILRFEAK